MKRVFLLILIVVTIGYGAWLWRSSDSSLSIPAGYYSGHIINDRGQVIYRILAISDGYRTSIFFTNQQSKLTHEAEFLKGHRLELDTVEGHLIFRSETGKLSGQIEVAQADANLSWELKPLPAAAGSLEIPESDIIKKISLQEEYNQQKIRLQLLNEKIVNQQRLNAELEEIIAEPEKLKTLMQEKKALAENSVNNLRKEISAAREDLSKISASQQTAARLSARGSLATAAREALELEGRIYQKLQATPVFATADNDSLEGDEVYLKSKILAEKDSIYLLKYKLKIPQNSENETEKRGDL